MLGSRLGPWTIDEELGRGGMGTVYLAHRPRENGPAERAAVKVLAPELAVEEGFLQRFQREIEIVRQLDHPNIVHFLESGESAGQYYFAMELVTGPSLQTMLEERQRLDWQEAIDIAMQIAPALKHAHDRGIIHRDIKPSNLLFHQPHSDSEDSLYKLTDFGIASLFSARHLTVTGGVVGTAEYLSPEQAAGKTVTPQSDIYSLGVVLYTLVTGKTPFAGEPMDLLHKHLYGQFDHPTRLVPNMPPAFADLLCQMLEKDPRKRPRDGHVLLKQLDVIKRREQLRTALAKQEGLGELGEELLSEDEPPPGPATLMSKLVRAELEQQNQGGPVRRFFNHPLVLVTLFVLCVGTIVWTFWPASQERLYEQGAALMETDPERAWSEYLGPLERKFPDHAYQDQLKEFREQLEEYRSQRQAAVAARKMKPMSEAQWFYARALRQRQQGDEDSARALWQALVEGFGEIPSEEPWVRLAKQRLAEQKKVERDWSPVEEAIARANTLRAEGKQAEAEQILSALRKLYKADPNRPKELDEPD